MRSLQVYRPCCTLHVCITAIYHSEFGETVNDLKRKNIYYTMVNEETMRNMLNMGGKWIPYDIWWMKYRENHEIFIKKLSIWKKV